MEKPLSEEIVDSILDGNKESFMAAFQAAIAAKVTDALEVKKVEIASTLITPEVAVEEEIDLDESKGEMDDEDEDEDEDKDEDEDSEDMKEEAVNNKMATINEDLGSAYEEIMASHHSARQKGRDALAAGNHAAAENHFVSAGLHLSKAEEVAKDYFKFHGVELHKPNHPRYSPYITGNWDKVT